MPKNVDFMGDIHAKYSGRECELEQQLKKIVLEEQKIAAADAVAKRVTIEDEQNRTQFCKNLATAKQRNADLIKELEISKARLRSRATYSPLELELNKAIANYNQMRSLTPIGSTTTRKVYGPTFV